MGGDGGQVIDRATMVKTKGWGLTKSAGNSYAASLGEMANYVQMITEDRGLGTLERKRTRMTQCFLSQEELRDPVVACKLGNLYNKEAMIGAILNKRIPESMSHIKKLSDLKNCQITWKQAEAEDGKKHMVCPISRDDLDAGNSRAVIIWSTGAVVGLKTLKALKAKDCPVTGKPFDFEQDVISLAPDDEELKKLQERLPASKKRKAPADSSSSKAEPVNTTADAASENTNGKAAAKETLGKTASEKTNGGCASDGVSASKKIKGSDVFKSLFTGDRPEGQGLTGPRDAFGKPMYNRGSTI